jgi:hypothetical protein
MRGSDKWIAVTAVIAICSFFANLLSVPTPVMATFAFALLGSLGYVWIEVILRGRAPTLELVSVAVGLVLSVPIIGGVYLQEAGIPLHRLAWSVLFVGLTLVGDVVLTFRWRSQARDDKYDYEYPLPIQYQDRLRNTRPDPRSHWEPIRDPALQSVQYTYAQPGKVKSRRHISPWQAGACGLALLITGGAIWLAQAGAASQHYPGFTELWLIGHSYSTSTDNLGISNQEGITENYRLVLLRKGHVSAKWEITLTTGQTWQRAVQVTAGTRADLYLLPDLNQPYRYVDTGP